MGLISDSTSWYFILPDNDYSHIRHLQDITFGCFVLAIKGINPKNIHIFINHYHPEDLKLACDHFNISLPVNPIKKIDEMSQIVDQETKSDIVVFVTGHGDENGFQCTPGVKPYDFYKQFYGNINIKNVVVFFGQCFAGVFNYMPLSKKLGLSDCNDANVIAVGSTSYDYSISSPVSVNCGPKWCGNVFLFWVLVCIAKNIDIDGDLNVTVMDAFKFASIKTKRTIADEKKKEDLKSFLGIQEAIDKLKDQQLSAQEKDKIELDIEAFKEILDIKLAEQSSWVLNAFSAMDMKF